MPLPEHRIDPVGDTREWEDPPEGLRYDVCCLRGECADSGVDRNAFWMPGSDGKGYAERVYTPLELTAFGNATVVDDLWDRDEAQKFGRSV